MPWRAVYCPILSWSLSLALHAGAIGAAWHWGSAWIADRDTELGARQGLVTIVASIGNDSAALTEPVMTTIETTPPSQAFSQPEAAPLEHARQPIMESQPEPVLLEVTLAPSEIQLVEQPKATGASVEMTTLETDSSSAVRTRTASASQVQLPGLSVPMEFGLTSASDPQFFRNVPPAYPADAQRRGWQGTVLLRLLIDEAGRVAEARVERSSGYELLDDTALEAVRRWRAQPALRRGKAVSTTAFQPIVFRLPR